MKYSHFTEFITRGNSHIGLVATITFKRSYRINSGIIFKNKPGEVSFYGYFFFSHFAQLS